MVKAICTQPWKPAKSTSQTRQAVRRVILNRTLRFHEALILASWSTLQQYLGSAFGPGRTVDVWDSQPRREPTAQIDRMTVIQHDSHGALEDRLAPVSLTAGTHGKLPHCLRLLVRSGCGQLNAVATTEGFSFIHWQSKPVTVFCHERPLTQPTFCTPPCFPMHRG